MFTEPPVALHLCVCCLHYKKVSVTIGIQIESTNIPEVLLELFCSLPLTSVTIQDLIYI